MIQIISMININPKQFKCKVRKNTLSLIKKYQKNNFYLRSRLKISDTKFLTKLKILYYLQYCRDIFYNFKT